MSRLMFHCVLVVIVALSCDTSQAGEKGLTNTWASPHVSLRCTDINDVHWTNGLWAERFEVCHKVMIPNMWHLLEDPNISHAYDNLLIAAGMKEGRHRGPKWHDGDFYKWLEAAAFVYGVTQDKALDEQMDRIIEVIGKAQREDGYIHSPVVIEQRKRGAESSEFKDRLDFETYNMGHLMTTACTHYRATGKTSLLAIATQGHGLCVQGIQGVAPDPGEQCHMSVSLHGRRRDVHEPYTIPGTWNWPMGSSTSAAW